MARSTRLNPTQQFQVAPSTSEEYTLVSDPADGGKYKHVPVANIAKPTEVTTATGALSGADIAADSKVFTVTQPAAGYAPSKAISDVNGKFNVGTVQAIAANATAGDYDITVTGFADESMADDELGLLIIWGFNPNA